MRRRSGRLILPFLLQLRNLSLLARRVEMCRDFIKLHDSLSYCLKENNLGNLKKKRKVNPLVLPSLLLIDLNASSV
jgi:hypothetical protein